MACFKALIETLAMLHSYSRGKEITQARLQSQAGGTWFFIAKFRLDSVLMMCMNIVGIIDRVHEQEEAVHRNSIHSRAGHDLQQI